MRRKPSRPSRKKSEPVSEPVWEFAEGPDLVRVLKRHPEVQATLEPLKLMIEGKSGRVLGRPLWPCPP